MGQSQAPRLRRIGVRFCHTHKKEQGSGQRPPPAMARGAQQEGAQGTRPTSYTPTVGTGPRRGVRVKRWGSRWVKPASVVTVRPPLPPRRPWRWPLRSRRAPCPPPDAVTCASADAAGSPPSSPAACSSRRAPRRHVLHAPHQATGRSSLVSRTRKQDHRCRVTLKSVGKQTKLALYFKKFYSVDLEI